MCCSILLLLCGNVFFPVYGYCGEGLIDQATDTSVAADTGHSYAVYSTSINQHVYSSGSDSVISKLLDLGVQPVSFIMPAALVAAGTYCLFNDDLRTFNKVAHSTVWNQREENGFVADHYMMFMPFAAYYGLTVAGVKGQHRAGEATLIYTMASVINNSIVYTVKNRSAIERPDASGLNSFPSGHAAQAFVSAEFLRQEYKHLSPWYGVAGYTVAIGTGILRMHHNKHWLNDVVAGAGVGILSTRVAYWLYPKVKKLVSPSAAERVMVAPSYSNGAYGLCMVYLFK